MKLTEITNWRARSRYKVPRAWAKTMKIEHITYMGSSVVRDSQIIEKETISFFSPISNGHSQMDIWMTPLSVEVSGNDFSLICNNSTLVVNICSFDSSTRTHAIERIMSACEKYELDMKYVTIPSSDSFIYSIIISMTGVFSRNEKMISDLLRIKNLLALMTICGEIEMYIYYSIFQREIQAKKISSDSIK